MVIDNLYDVKYDPPRGGRIVFRNVGSQWN
jgi:hypothetical protein